MKIRVKKLSADVVLLFLYFAPVIDNFVGATMRSTGEDSALGKGYRLFFLAFILLYYCMHATKNKFRKLTIIVCAIIILPLIYSLLHGTTAGIITDYIQLSKLFYPIALFGVLENMVDNQVIDTKRVYKCIRYYRWFYPLSLLIPYALGWGYQSYKTYDAGYSGFYGAGNELSVVLVAMFIISLYDSVNNRDRIALIPTFMNAICILLTGAKTGMIMLIVGTIVIMLHTPNIRLRFLRFITLTVICVPIAMGILYLMRQQMDSTIRMIQFKYNQMNTDIVSFLLSNRNNKILPNFNNSIFDNPKGFINLLIGRGYYDQAVSRKASVYVASAGLIEIDLFDMLFQHGIIITVAVVHFYLKNLVNSYPCIELWGAKFAAGIIMLFGVLAGHTFQSTLPATSMILLLICSEHMNYGYSALKR